MVQDRQELPESKEELKSAFWKAATAGDLYRQTASYLFWGATALLGIALGGAFLGVAEFGAVATGLNMSSFGLGAALGGASLGAGAGSLYFSRKSAEQNEQNGLIYSKIHSEDIGESVAKAIVKEQMTGQLQEQVVKEEQLTPSGPSWVERSGAASLRTTDAGNWLEYLQTRDAQSSQQDIKI